MSWIARSIYIPIASKDTNNVPYIAHTNITRLVSNSLSKV
jgi:hypothetical protein